MAECATPKVRLVHIHNVPWGQYKTRKFPMVEKGLFERFSHRWTYGLICIIFAAHHEQHCCAFCPTHKNPSNPQTRIRGNICVLKYRQILFFYLAEQAMYIGQFIKNLQVTLIWHQGPLKHWPFISIILYGEVNPWHKENWNSVM